MLAIDRLTPNRGALESLTLVRSPYIERRVSGSNHLINHLA
jgi:hypothetical protein